MLYVFDNIFDEDAYAAFVNTATMQRECTFGHTSNDDSLPIFMTNPNSDMVAKAEQILAYINALGIGTFELTQKPHINVQPHGFDGSFHIDNDESGTTHAASFYFSPQISWTKKLGGFLIYGDPDTGDARAVTPLANRLVLHKADVQHCGLSPSLAAGAVVRYSLTLKLKQTS